MHFVIVRAKDPYKDWFVSSANLETGQAKLNSECEMAVAFDSEEQAKGVRDRLMGGSEYFAVHVIGM